MKPEPTPNDLVAMARSILRRATPASAGVWPRAAALLARQALEAALVNELGALNPALTSCPIRVQLLCLSGLTSERELAVRVAHAWSALSDACHHHVYETAPGVAELDAWLSIAGRFAGLTPRGGGQRFLEWQRVEETK